MNEQHGSEYAQYVMRLIRGMLPLESLRTGDAAIMVVGIARHENSSSENMVAGIFSNVEIAQEKLAGIIDRIYSGEEPDESEFVDDETQDQS